MMEDKFKPCPFCGSKTVEHYTIDEDSFWKTIVVRCRGNDCTCRLEAKINWKPFSKTDDFDGYEKSVLKIALHTWNLRFEKEGE